MRRVQFLAYCKESTRKFLAWCEHVLGYEPAWGLLLFLWHSRRLLETGKAQLWLAKTSQWNVIGLSPRCASLAVFWRSRKKANEGAAKRRENSKAFLAVSYPSSALLVNSEGRASLHTIYTTKFMDPESSLNLTYWEINYTGKKPFFSLLIIRQTISASGQSPDELQSSTLRPLFCGLYLHMMSVMSSASEVYHMMQNRWE